MALSWRYKSLVYDCLLFYVHTRWQPPPPRQIAESNMEENIQCVPIKTGNPFYQWDIFIAMQHWNKLYASLSRAFSLLSFDTKHIRISQCMNERDQFKLMHVKNLFWRIMVLKTMTKFKLANPCQNKESKQKKHDDIEPKEIPMNVFQHVPLFWIVADPVKPLNSHSAQIIFEKLTRFMGFLFCGTHCTVETV